MHVRCFLAVADICGIWYGAHHTGVIRDFHGYTPFQDTSLGHGSTMTKFFNPEPSGMDMEPEHSATLFHRVSVVHGTSTIVYVMFCLFFGSDVIGIWQLG